MLHASRKAQPEFRTNLRLQERECLGTDPERSSSVRPAALRSPTRAGGWVLLMALNHMLFSLVHKPCSANIYTIYQETRSAKWTAVSALLPVAMESVLCFLVAQVWRIVAEL